MNLQYKKFFVFGVFLFLNISFICSQKEQAVIDLMKTEVDRNLSGLKIENLLPPFYIRYVILDNEFLDMSASGGFISQSNTSKSRYGLPFVLVGDFFRNNVSYVSNSVPMFFISTEDSGIATGIWNGLDNKYKQAAEDFEAKKAVLSQENQTMAQQKVADYEDTPCPDLLLKPAKMNMDPIYWENYIRKGSEVFNKYPEIISSQVSVAHRNTMAYCYDTKKGKYAIPNSYYKITVNISILNDNGQVLNDDWPIEYSYFESVPDLKSFISLCEQYADDMMKRRNAPMVTDPYIGPVLFENHAAMQTYVMQFFYNQSLMAQKKQIFSQGNSNIPSPGQSMEDMIGKQIISPSLNIVSLTGTESYNGVKLDGYYPMDLEGVVPDKELFLVKKGVLKTLLNRRIPTLKVPHTNGHARFNVFSRQTIIAPGNIHVYSDEAIPLSDLKHKLIAAAKEENLEYAYIVRRMRPNLVLSIYKIYVEDGREELVRGAMIQGLNLRSFKKILGVSKEEFFYNHTGLGQIATYIVPYGILFEEMEVLRDNKISLKPPYVVPQPN